MSSRLLYDDGDDDDNNDDDDDARFEYAQNLSSALNFEVSCKSISGKPLSFVKIGNGLGAVCLIQRS